MSQRKLLFLLGCLASVSPLVHAEEGHSYATGLEVSTEMQASASDGLTPLWLQANRYGLSSLDGRNGYLRLAVERDIRHDSGRHWGLGYGADVYTAYHYQSEMAVQQLYFKARYRMLSLTLGQKQEAPEFMHSELSTGGQTLGINARPLPGVRAGIDDYWSLPGLRGWLAIRGHVFYGVRTDGDWNERFSLGYNGYGKRVLQHNKAGYLRIGSPRYALSVEGGLQMATMWGGLSYNKEGDQTGGDTFEFGQLYDAFICKEDNSRGVTSIGNVLGSWLMKINFSRPQYDMHLYADVFFERKSGMFFSNKYGETFGENGESITKTYNYPLKDMLLGFEVNNRNFPYLNGFVFEYLYTKYQQGPLGHESSQYIPDVLSGMNSFYNHGATGWIYWGQVIGNPLYRSAIYNTDHSISVENNRFVAFHLGVSGNPTERLHYRLLWSWQRGYGTYYYPYLPSRRNVSLMAEVSYRLGGKANSVLLTGALGSDHGELLGNNLGARLSVRYSWQHWARR